jgi:hypothetical protein
MIPTKLRFIQKQELSVEARFANGLGQNEQSL